MAVGLGLLANQVLDPTEFRSTPPHARGQRSRARGPRGPLNAGSVQRFISACSDDSEGCSEERGSPTVASIIISLIPHPGAGWQNAKEINLFYCNSHSEKKGFTRQIKRVKKLAGGDI